MEKLINELTVYSGIDNNKIPYHFHKIQVDEYFRDCIEEVGLDLESMNFKLDYVNLVSQDTTIIADPEQLSGLSIILSVIVSSIWTSHREK